MASEVSFLCVKTQYFPQLIAVAATASLALSAASPALAQSEEGGPRAS